ncbi:MAG: hypothetical protein WCO56_28535 [Verrucomicrobiota bacterium]
MSTENQAHLTPPLVPELPMHSTPLPPVAPPSKKRRRWLYVVIPLASLLLLAILAVAGIGLYVHSLVQTYTSLKPAVLPKGDASPAALKAVFMRLGDFKIALENSKPVRPLRISADDLNALIAADAKQQGRLFMRIQDNVLWADFSLPLDQDPKNKNNKMLKGRYANGVAALTLKRGEDGFLSLKVKSIKANGKDIPGWLLKKAQEKDLLDQMQSNAQAAAILQHLDDVQIKDNCITLVPVDRL